MPKSLRIRLTLWYVGALAAILVAFSVASYSLLAASFRQRLDGLLRSATQVTALALNHETEEHNGKDSGEENVRFVLNTMHQTSFPRPDISVWDGDRLVAVKPGTAGLGPEFLEGIRELADPETAFHTFERSGTRYRAAIAKVWVPSSRGSYVVIANESLLPVEAEMRTVGEVLLVVVPVCLLLAAAGGYFLARKSLAPVLNMARAAERISSDNLEQRLAVENPHDELGLLAETFNRLLARLQQSFRQQRQFMADASHELRTPVSVALTAVQVSLQNHRRADGDDRDTLTVIQSQMLRLRRVVEDMFTLAQADSGGHQLTKTTFYLDEVLLESVRAGKVLGGARGVEIGVGPVATEATYEGDEGLLRQLFLILLDNAVKFTGAGGSVSVSFTASHDRFTVRIADTGCGIPASDRPHIFDRFYRVDKSHSRRQPGAGSGAGLGLAIAQWITNLHRGTIHLEKSDEQGSVFRIELPVVEPQAPLPTGPAAASTANV